MSINLRPASAADEEFARLLHHSAYRDVVLRQFGKWDESIQDKFFYESWCPEEARIVQFDGLDVGCVQRRKHEDYLELIEIQLLPEYQGRGIGSQLLRKEIATAEKAGMPIRLRVLRENRAQQLYMRMGFSVYGTTETHVLMERKV